MDQMFFSWLAAQPYSVEVAIGAIFVVILAPAVMGGMAALAGWSEHLIVEVLRLCGVLEPLEREKKILWRLLPKSAPRGLHPKAEEPARPSRHGSRAAG